MFAEEDLLPISAIQHLAYCPRRAALIHVESKWAENAQTAQGRVLHRHVHESTARSQGEILVTRGLRLSSRSLGLFGVADVVEFHPAALGTAGGVAVPGRPGIWLPFPVEYKRGRRKVEMSYFVQLCAQALCLEEMLGAAITEGALYHGQSRRRQTVTLDSGLRERTIALARRLHELIQLRQTPAPEFGPKCRYCSLAEQCMPKLRPSRSAQRYLSTALNAILGDT